MHEANPFVNYWLNGNVKDVSNVILYNYRNQAYTLSATSHQLNALGVKSV